EAMAKGGLLERFGVDAVFGLHLWNGFPVGKVGCSAGPVMASVGEFILTLRGRGGHGAMSHLSVDPIVAAAHVVTALQSIASPEMADLAEQALVEALGRENVVTQEPTMGGEDFSYFLERAPGAFIFVGSANAERGLNYPHHHARFDFDERALPIGVKALTAVA